MIFCASTSRTACECPTGSPTPSTISTRWCETPRAWSGVALLALAAFLAGAGVDARFSSADPRARLLAYRTLEETSAPREILDQIAAAISNEEDPEVRAAARDAMARLPLDEPDLIAVLGGSPQPISRAWAAYALGRYHSTASVEALIAAADDPDEAVRREIYGAMGHSGDRLALPTLSRAAVREPSATLRSRAEQAALDVVSGRGHGLDVSTELALLEGGDLDDRIRAAKVLGESGDWRALNPLLVAARASDPGLREAALLALGHLGNHRAVTPLTELVATSTGKARYDVLAALANLADPAAVPALEALLADPDYTTRQLSLRALAWIAAPGTAELAGGMLEDPSEQVRAEAVLTLGGLVETARVPALIRAAGDPSAFVRAEVARLLGEAGDSAASATLLALLSDRDPLVQLTAADALVQLGAVEALPALQKTMDRARTDEQRTHYAAAIAALGGVP